MLIFIYVKVILVKSRIIRTNTTLNTRDLGNLKTTNNKTTMPCIFIRSDNLVSNEDSIYTIMDLINNHNLKTVVDLRAKKEVDQGISIASKIKGINYYNISLVNFMPLGQGIPKDSNYKELSEWYIEILEKSKNEIKEVLEIIYKHKKGCTLFNCTMGKDRTSIIAMLLLLIAKVDKKAIARDHAISAKNVVDYYAPYLHSMNNNQIVFTKVKYKDMIRTIEYIEAKYKNINNYLLSCGIEDKVIKSLRRRLVK